MTDEVDVEEGGLMRMKHPVVISAIQQPGSKQCPEDFESKGFGVFGTLVVVLVCILAILLFPFMFWTYFRIIQPYERGVKLRLGKLYKHRNDRESYILGAGIHLILPCIEKLFIVDMRTMTVNLPPHEVLTKDSVTVNLNAMVYVHVVEPVRTVTRLGNWQSSAQFLSAGIIRRVIGNYELTELLNSQDEINAQMRKLMDEATSDWGIQVERIEIKDITLPTKMQRPMTVEAQAVRSSQAHLISSKGELNSAKMLLDAASILSTTPAALQLRFLQALNSIAAKQNSTIIFPLPIELLNSLKH